jgi:hypothetical protein
MLLTLKKSNDRLIPADEESVKVFTSLSLHQEICVEYKPRRNYKFHKKLFSMLNLIKNNQDTYKSVDNILTECKFDAGYFDIHINQKGEQLLLPKSINFTTMKADEFEEFYSCCIDTCLKLVPMGKTELEEAILRYV